MPKSPLDDAIKFCQDARNILGTPGYSYGTYDTVESKAAKKALDAVTSKLKEFREKGSLDYKKCALEFYDLAKLGKISAASNDRSLALTLTARLVDLSNRLDAAAGKAVDLNRSRATLTTAVEGIYQADLAAANVKKKELNDKNTQPPAHILYGGPFTFDGGVEKLIGEASSEAVTPDPNPATQTATLLDRADKVTKAIEILARVKNAHSEGLKLHTDYEAYKTQMDQAEKYRVELFLLSKDKVDYSAPVTNEMNVARGTARDAASNGSPHDFKAAVTKLNGVISLYNTGKQNALAAEGKEKLAAEKKPDYDDKVRRIQNDIRELEALPGTQSAVAELEKRLKAGRDEVDKSRDYELARQSLKGSNDARKAGKKAADNFNKTMDPEYKKELEKARNKLLEVERLVGRSKFKEIAEQQQAIDESVMRLSQPSSNPIAEKSEISRIFGELQALATTEAEKRRACEQAKNAATKNIEEFQKLYLIANYDVLPKFRQAESEFAVDNYGEAKILYEEVIEDLSGIELREENKPAYDKWSYSRDGFETELKTLAKVREFPYQYLRDYEYEGSKTLLQLEARATTLLKNLELTRDYSEAYRVAGDVKRAMTAINIEEILKQCDDMKKRREKLRGDANIPIAFVEEKISALGVVKGHVEEFESTLKILREEWNNILDTYVELETEEALNETYTDFVKKLASQIITPIDAMLSAFAKDKTQKEDSKAPGLTNEEQADLDKLTDSIKAASNKKTAKEFEQKFSEISATITLMKKDASAYESLVITAKILETSYIENATNTLERIKKELAVQLSKDTPDFDPLKRSVEDLEDDLTAVKEALDAKRSLQSTAAITKIKPCSDLLKQLKDSNPKFETFFKKFTNQVEDLRAMADSKIFTTVVQCVESAKDLEEKLNKLTPKSFSDINKVLEHIEEEFEKLKDTLPVRLAGLKMRFEKKIEPDLYEEGPDVGKSKVKAFLDEVNAAVKDADAAQISKGKITSLVTDCSVLLLTMTDAPESKKSFQGMITSASTPAEGDEESAQQRLEIIKMQIKRLKEMSAEDLLKEEQSKVREKNTEELRRIRFEAELKVFTDKLSKEATILMESTKPNENSDLYAQISELTNEADKMFKDRNFDGALKKLDAARTAARRFLNNPFSIKVNTRNNLKKVGEDWLKTISTFVKSMNKLIEAVEASMTTENALSVKNSEGEKFAAASFTAMKEPLTEAARSFEATKFPDYIDKILKADDPANVREYRRLKEDALRFVRAYQTIVTEDPVLLSAASNPFGVVVSLSSVKDALGVLEINLRRA